jgi:hypothetical protein
MEGSGKMLVIAVGEHSQTGLICSLLRSPIHTSRIRILLFCFCSFNYYEKYYL